MTTAPVVELGFNPTDLRPQDLPRAGAFLGSPAEALEAALAVARAQMVDQVRSEIKGIAEPTQAQLLRIADLAWQTVFWNFRRVSAPVIADAYIRAYRKADAGDVPMSVVYNLADKHAEKIGEYFHTSSRGALAEGFTTLVNRRVSNRAAANQVLDGFGLTTRQMRSYTSAKQFQTPVDSPVPRALKAKARAYVDKALTGRIRKMSQQEEHNIDQQAQQFAWMWLQDKGRLNEKAQKLWITAKDERVCEICGPLHGKKVGVNERFVTSHGEFWTPGLHPNCRCVVRLLEHRFSKADWEEHEHPRGQAGRFSTKARPPARAKVKEREPTRAGFQAFLDQIESQPVIETAEEAPERISLDQGVSLGGVSLGGVSLDEGVSLGGRVSLGGGKASSGGKTALGQRISPEELRSRIELAVSPEMRVALEETMERVLLADVTRPNVAVKPKSLYYRPTLKVQDPEGKEYPVYAVVGMTEPIDYSNDQVELNPDIVFSPDLAAIKRKHDKLFQAQIQEAYEDTINNDEQRLSFTDSGTEWTVDLDEEELLSVIMWKAYKGRVPEDEYGWKIDEDIHLEWTGGGGERVLHHHRKDDLARMLSLDDDDFAVRILRLDEGHDSNLGKTTQRGAGTKYGTEEWVTSGLYRAEPMTQEVEAKHGTELIEIFHLEPDVLETEIKSIFE